MLNQSSGSLLEASQKKTPQAGSRLGFRLLWLHRSLLLLLLGALNQVKNLLGNHQSGHRYQVRWKEVALRGRNWHQNSYYFQEPENNREFQLVKQKQG